MTRVTGALNPGHPASPPQLLQMARREVEFYRFAQGEIEGLPRCYFADADIEAGQALLLLEDLSDGEPGDALAGCSVDEAGLVLRSIGRVHARWWKDKSLSPLDWLGSWSVANQRRAERLRAQAEIVTAAFADRLPEPVIELIRGLVEPYGEVLADLAAAPKTLIHGDLHLDNVMFIPSERGRRASIIDWQGPSRGPAVVDLAGFIAEALDIEDRRASEEQLLREYHDDLIAAGVEDYSCEQLFNDYRRALCVRAAGQVGWLARVIEHEPVDRERQLVDALFDPGRVFAALLDHGIDGESTLG